VKPTRFMSIFQELKRRNVIRVGIAFALIAWVLLQGADFVLDLIDAPNWVIQVLALLAVIGWLVGLVFAWVFEVTPEGIKRESQIDRNQAITPQTGRKLDRIILIVLALAVVILLADRVFVDRDTGENRAPTPTAVSVSDRDVPTESPAGRVSIAVLPFVNMSSDPEQEYFSDGITEEVLNRLAGVRGLQVAARTSAFSFKGQNQDVRQIAQLLGVGHILEGSVRKAGDQVRITAQLIRAEDGFHLWSEAYDRKLENIFAIQDDIASEIAGALQVSLGVSGQSGQGSVGPVNPEVYDLYLRARALHRARGPGVVEAISLFERALAIDPHFAPAWAGLSHSYNVVLNYVSQEEAQALGDVGAKSLAAAEKALELAPNLPSAQHAMGNNLFFRFDWAQAERYYRRALMLDPDSADIMEDYTAMLTYSWQLDEAMEVANRMIELDPRVPIFLLGRSEVYYAKGDLESAVKDMETALAISPTLSNLQVFELWRLLRLRDFDGARRYARQMNPEMIDIEDQLQLIDWLEDPLVEPGVAVTRALEYFPRLAILANRFDLWLNAVESAGAVWSEWGLTPSTDLIAPFVPAEQLREMRADPRTRAYLQWLQLPGYWREVGWPEPCRPLGEDDFTCD
jgi:TolB-like protein/tetratricopeptide (TPR) repeat protein